MRRSLSCFLLCLALSAPIPAMAQDAVHALALGDRTRFGRIIHIYGDSISRGYALGVPADTVSTSDPLYPLASIRATANWAANTLNDVKDIYVYGGPIYPTVLDGVIETVDMVRSGDLVIVEDAGDHGSDPDAYEEWWLDVREAVTGKRDVTLVMMTMFDYCHDGNYACETFNQYDLPFNGTTMNEATEAAAEAEGDYVGQTIFIDMNEIMDEARAHYLATDGLDIMLPDGVHPNVWGQTLMTAWYLRAAGLRQDIDDIALIKGRAWSNYQSLQYGSSITADRASEIMEELLRD